jgi:hypothetical protein
VFGVSADGLGNVYISGYTEGSLGGTNAGGTDAFVAKITDPLLGDVNFDGDVNGLDVDPFVAAVVGGTQAIPEPSTFLLALVALAVVGGWRKWAA